MLIHPWDAALDPAEWQEWLASTDRFGILAVNNLDPAQAPPVLPTLPLPKTSSTLVGVEVRGWESRRRFGTVSPDAAG